MAAVWVTKGGLPLDFNVVSNGNFDGRLQAHREDFEDHFLEEGGSTSWAFKEIKLDLRKYETKKWQPLKQHKVRRHWFLA